MKQPVIEAIVLGVLMTASVIVGFCMGREWTMDAFKDGKLRLVTKTITVTEVR